MGLSNLLRNFWKTPTQRDLDALRSYKDPFGAGTAQTLSRFDRECKKYRIRSAAEQKIVDIIENSFHDGTGYVLSRREFKAIKKYAKIIVYLEEWEPYERISVYRKLCVISEEHLYSYSTFFLYFEPIRVDPRLE